MASPPFGAVHLRTRALLHALKKLVGYAAVLRRIVLQRPPQAHLGGFQLAVLWLSGGLGLRGLLGPRGGLGLLMVIGGIGILRVVDEKQAVERVLAGVGDLKGAVLSTRGPGWTDLWCTGCIAKCIAG